MHLSCEYCVALWATIGGLLVATPMFVGRPICDSGSADLTIVGGALGCCKSDG